ncbi:MAG: hypothetical protein LC789_03970 [Actinobacteria bacterium]|nr:hypothetical protein [Actinomycetota bacterium]MCA1721745.1 hypothetical protein [Actinomycetota bacterium]
MTAYVLELRQRFSPLQNRYDVIGVDPAGAQTPLGYAEQKRFSLKEKVTFWASADRSQVVFTIGARNMFEIAGTYDVAAGDGTPLAVIAKDVVSSFTRSTYKVDVNGRPLVGKERSAAQAIARRAMELFTDLPWFLPIHFDFTDAAGATVLTIERQMKLRDVYRVAVEDPTLDWRVPAALAVTVDAFMNR